MTTAVSPSSRPTGRCPVGRTAPDGALFYEVWSTDAMPTPIDLASSDPTLDALTVPPAPNGTKIRINGPYGFH